MTARALHFYVRQMQAETSFKVQGFVVGKQRRYQVEAKTDAAAVPCNRTPLAAGVAQNFVNLSLDLLLVLALGVGVVSS